MLPNAMYSPNAKKYPRSAMILHFPFAYSGFACIFLHYLLFLLCAHCMQSRSYFLHKMRDFRIGYLNA